MRAIVIGGAGFIGSNLVHGLLEQGHEAFVIDNLHTGVRENLEGLDVGFMESDASGLKDCGFERADVIFHQGIYSSSPMYKEDRTLMAKAINQFVDVMEYARVNDCKVVFASTSSLYNGVEPPHSEDAIIPIKDFYSEVRLFMERTAKIYNEFYGTKVIGLRYFSVYGPREEHKGEYANLVSQFIWDMKKGEEPVIYGDGEQRRDFVYVQDVVRANMLAFESDVDYGIFNVGTGKNYSLNQLVQMLNRGLGTEIKPEYVENKIKNYVSQNLADTKRAKEQIGFEAKIDLEKGIEMLLKL